MRYRLAVLLLSASFSLMAGVPAVKIKVADQNQFDHLQSSILQALSTGTDRIDVSIDRGTYFFREDHIRLEYQEAPGVTLTIDGGGSVFLGTGPDFLLSGGSAPYPGTYDVRHGFYSYRTGGTLFPTGKVGKALSPVEPCLGASGLFRLKVAEEDWTPDARDAAYIVISQWYLGRCYRIEKIRSGYIYFRSQDTLLEMNGDITYGRSFPKYMFYNYPLSGADVHISGGKIHAEEEKVHQCEASRFLTVWNGSLGHLVIKDIHFAGNGGKDYLIQLFMAKMESAEVSGCTFSGIQDRVLSTHCISHVAFHDNVVRDCWRLALYLDMFSDQAEVYRNRFENIGCAFEGTAVMEVLGAGMAVHDNVLQDFSYAGIMSGIHFTCDQPVSTSGLIERNELFHSDAFRKEPSRTLMDAGAIYVGTMNAGLVIRNNYIHDIRGAKDYRGIFGDDGAYGVTVYGNLVLDTPTSYSIDFRRVASVETRADSYAERVNVDNRIYGNTVDGKVRFETRGGDDGCYKGENRVLKTDAERRSAVAAWRRKYGRHLPR